MSDQCQRIVARRRAATAAAVTRAARVNIIIIRPLRHVMTVTKPRLIIIYYCPGRRVDGPFALFNINRLLLSYHVCVPEKKKMNLFSVNHTVCMFLFVSSFFFRCHKICIILGATVFAYTV